MLSSMRISAGRLGYSALVIFDMPTRMSANPSNSRRNGSHGTQFPCADSEAPGGISRKARSIGPRRCRIAAIWAAEMQARPSSPA
jgi:hypothetical protein